MPTINATFETRRDAELAVEHLVQNHEIERDAITIGIEGDENSVGEVQGDEEGGDDDNAALNGAIAVSVSVEHEDEADTVLDVLHEYGGADVTQDD